MSGRATWGAMGLKGTLIWLRYPYGRNPGRHP